MKLHIYTQDQENYGAHDWSGEGECPEYWKFKGGSDFMVENFKGNRCRSLADSATEAVMILRTQIEEDNNYFRRQIVGWNIVDDDYMTDFEKSQLEYEGSILYPAKVLELC